MSGASDWLEPLYLGAALDRPDPFDLERAISAVGTVVAQAIVV